MTQLDAATSRRLKTATHVVRPTNGSINVIIDHSDKGGLPHAASIKPTPSINGYCCVTLFTPPRRICNRRCWLVGLSCLLATLRKNFPTDLHEICREGRKRANEQTIKFWWRSGSRIRCLPVHFPRSKLEQTLNKRRETARRSTFSGSTFTDIRQPTLLKLRHTMCLSRSSRDVTPSLLVKVKFYQAIWSQTGSKLVADLQRAEIWPVI